MNTRQRSGAFVSHAWSTINMRDLRNWTSPKRTCYKRLFYQWDFEEMYRLTSRNGVGKPLKTDVK